MASETSLDAFDELKRSGRHTELLVLVYEMIDKHGPITAKEISRIIRTARDNISPRVGELKEVGLIGILGTRPCRVTKKNVEALVTLRNHPLAVTLPKKRRWFIVNNHACATQGEAIGFGIEEKAVVFEAIEVRKKKLPKLPPCTDPIPECQHENVVDGKCKVCGQKF